jgi:transposase
MKYNKEEQMEIGRQLYKQEISHKEAMQKYGVSSSSIDHYILAYKESIGIKKTGQNGYTVAKSRINDADMETYKAMSKEELINELILAKANELRAKKGYEVKGDGANKEFISINNKNMK